MLIIGCYTDVINTDIISTGISSAGVIIMGVISTDFMSSKYLPLHESIKYMQYTSIICLIICQLMSFNVQLCTTNMLSNAWLSCKMNYNDALV